MEFLSLAQFLGLISYLLVIITFSQKNDKRLKVMMMVFNVNHCCHYLLLGAEVSAINAAISALRTGLSVYISSGWAIVFFIALSFGLGGYAAQTWLDIFSSIGMCIGTYALFALKGLKLRIACVLGSLCWLINNILVGSIGGILLETTVMMMNLHTIYRIRYGTESIPQN